jgi:hypothetical protein
VLLNIQIVEFVDEIIEIVLRFLDSIGMSLGNANGHSHSIAADGEELFVALDRSDFGCRFAFGWGSE